MVDEKSQTLSGKFATPFNLSWSQYVFLISIDNPEERRFYEIEASADGWTLPELKRQFNSGLYERLALNRDQDEYPTVGIILCKKKHDALVKISLPKETNIHAREYQLYLPDKELLRQKLLEWSEEAERNRG